MKRMIYVLFAITFIFATSTLVFAGNGETPGVPQNVKAEVYSPSAAIVKWVPGNPLNQTDFWVYASSDNGSTWIPLAGFAYKNADSCIVYNLDSKGTYIFKVLARRFDRGITYYSKFSNVSNEVTLLPTGFSLNQNFPNPFNPTTVISYSVPSTLRVTLKIYNVLGKEVMTLVDAEKTAGNYNATFDASNLPSGVYIYRIQAGKFSEAKRMVLVK